MQELNKWLLGHKSMQASPMRSYDDSSETKVARLLRSNGTNGYMFIRYFPKNFDRIFVEARKILLQQSMLAELLHHLDFTWTPALIQPWFERAIHAKDGEPTLAGTGFQPVVRVTFWSLGCEVDVGRSILVLFDPFCLAANCRKELTGL